MAEKCRRIVHLTKANFHKNKGQTISFLIVVFLSSLLMDIGLLTWRNYVRCFDQKAEELHTADAIFVARNDDAGFVKRFCEELNSDSRTKKTVATPVLFADVRFSYGNGEQSRQVVIMDAAKETDISRISYDNMMEQPPEDVIYLPYLFYAGGGYKAGDSYTLSFQMGEMGDKDFTYTIGGFYEEIHLGTINSEMTGFVLEQKAYETLEDSLLGMASATMFLTRLSERGEAEKFVTDHTVSLAEQAEYIGTSYYEMVKSMRTMTSSIGSMIIVAFSIIIACISLIMTRFRIGNYIEEEMTNIGALKAIGYTSREIILSILCQFLSAAAAGCAAGIAVSYIFLPFVSYMFAVQTGFVWRQGFDFTCAMITIIFICLAVFFTALICARKIWRLHPIVALRNGILTHSFKRNPFPLSRWSGNLTLLLSGKESLQNLRQNLIVGTVIAAMSFTAVFAGALYYNAVIDEDKMIAIVSGEVQQIQIVTNSRDNQKKLLSSLQNMPQVRKAVPFMTNKVSNEKDGSEIICYVTDDYARLDNQNWVYDGRFPQYDNEIAINGLLAKNLKKKTGDEISISANKTTQRYLISGLIQGSNFMGRDSCMTIAAYQKLAPDFWSPSLNVYLKEEVEVEAFVEELKQKFPQETESVVNIGTMIDSAMGAYQSIITIIAWVILIITAAMIALTLYLVIKTMLLRKKKELGIKKAIGFLTKQLVLQIALSFLPPILFGTAAGALLGYAGVNPLLSALFSAIGVMKVDFVIPPEMLFGLIVCITLTGFFMSVLASLGIRKVTPYTLMSE